MIHCVKELKIYKIQVTIKNIIDTFVIYNEHQHLQLSSRESSNLACVQTSPLPQKKNLREGGG